MKLVTIFSHPDILVFVAGDIVNVITYMDGADSLYYPADRFIDVYSDVTPAQAVSLLDMTDMTLW